MGVEFGEKDRFSLLHVVYTNGKLNRASHPGPVARFCTVMAPPCASAIFLQSTKPIPEPPGLVVKKGTNRLLVPDKPGPSSSTSTSRCALRLPQPMVT